MASEISIVLFGASGQMGKEVIASAARKGVKVLGGVVGADDPACGTSVASVEHALSADWVDAYDGADAIIDFSLPAGAKRALEIAKERKIPALICTTGLDDSFDSLISDASSAVPVIRASNTSIGVNALLKLVSHATKLIGDEFETEITEIHHRFKKDAPSGTAISLAEEIASAKGNSLESISSYGRSGDDLSRAPGELGIQSIRGGDVAGEHTVYFISDGERIELTHRATTRAIFADGAIRAAVWLAGKKDSPGVYSMGDVLSTDK